MHFRLIWSMISPVRLPGIFYPWCYLHVHIAQIGDILGVARKTAIRKSQPPIRKY